MDSTTTMNKLKTLAVLTMSIATLGTAYAAPEAPVVAEPEAVPTRIALDRIIAVVNNDVITERELQERTHVVAINLRRQNIQLPDMAQLRQQVLVRLISEKTIMQRARETGIRIDDQMVNASIEQIALSNNITVDQLRQRLMADGVSFGAFREEIRDEIITQRLREREVDSKIVIPESEIDAFLAEKAGFSTSDTSEYRIAHILLPIDDANDADDVEDRAEEIADKAREGEDFATLVATYSKASDAMQGGDIGWRDIQNLPSEFLTAMKKDDRTGSVHIAKTSHAWHVFKVLGQRDGVQHKLAGGPINQTHVRHILMFVSDITPEAEVVRRLNDIKRRIESGEADFATMARLNSVDNSATRGGDLGWVQAGDTLPPFENAMNMLKPGEVSDPVKTQYGYHLIQVEERRLEKDGNPERMRLAARQALRQRKMAEAAFNWQRELRDRAYVEIRNHEAY